MSCLVKTMLIRGTNENSYRSGEWGVVTGFYSAIPEGLPPRGVFQVTYSDGDIDYIPQADTHNYELKQGK